MASASINSSTTAGAASHTQAARNSIRQTRTNPSRISKTVARSFSLYGQSSATDAPQTPAVPHGFFPALTHFTDAITALPREFRRHNSLLKEVDAKAWALEENLQQLLSVASDSGPVPYPPNPAPIVNGVVREYAVSQDATQPAESQESRNRRILFDRIRHTLSDLMMTADEKNHVITNANDELDHQLYRLDSIYPYISGEVSDEARLGSLTHWAYSNRTNTKATTANERPRREAATATSHLVQALHEAEAASRSEARREAVMARKRRNHGESDFDEIRNGGVRKGAVARARAAGAESADAPVAGGAAPTKRRKVEKPPPVQIGSTAMERSLSGVPNAARIISKDGTGNEVKKRARAPNALSTAGRKRNNTVTSNAGSPSAVSSPLVGTFNPPRSAPSPAPNGANRPQSSRAHQSTGQANARQRPASSASNRANANNKALDSKATTSKEATPQAALADSGRQAETEDENSDTKTNLVLPKDDLSDVRVVENAPALEKSLPTISTAVSSKGRTSKNSTPVVSTFSESQSRARPSRNNNEAAPPKRSHKKSGSVSTTTYKPRVVPTEDEESSREGDDEDDEGEPRYCYCNEVSFGEMVACDNDACPREWFHLSCVGLTKPPGKNVKWYCNECKEAMKRGRAGGR